MGRQTGVVTRRNNNTSGYITNPQPGEPEIYFELDDQHKKKGGEFVPVPKEHRFLPNRGKVVHLVEVQPTADGPRAVKWRSM